MIPPQVGMRLRTKKEKKEKKERPKRSMKKMREKERTGNVTILFHTCASE
jgi:hypothetical protein